MTKQVNFNARDDTLEEVQSPNFFRFENIGDTIQGRLLGKGESDQFGFGLYTIETDNGMQLRFHGSAQLDDLMFAVKPGEWVKIVYYDNQKMAKGTMKLFKVYRRKA